MRRSIRLAGLAAALAATASGCAVARTAEATAPEPTRTPSGTIAVGTSQDSRSVLLIDPGSGAVTRVRAPTSLLELRTELSPGGTAIAVTGLDGIWVMARDGSGGRHVVGDEDARTLPGDASWSPNGRRLVFVWEDDLFTIDADDEIVEKKGLDRLWRGYAYAPDWSPTGREIIFVRNPQEVTGGGLISAIGADGRNLRAIVTGGHPDVSPDGSKIAFARPDGVYVVPIEGGEPRRVVRDAERPEWSPDGKYLAFTRVVRCGEAGCDGRVFVVPESGGRARPVGPALFEIGRLSWSR
jgi:Tol biopolymer transport system component